MSSPKHLLVSCITLLCLEQRPDSPASPSNELVDTVLDNLELKETTVDHEHGRQTFLELKKYVGELNVKIKTNFPDMAEVLQTVQVICREETYLYDAIRGGIKEDFPDGMAIMHRINSYRKSLNEYINDEVIKKIMKEYSSKLLFGTGRNVDIPSMISEMGAKLDPYVSARAEARHPAEVGSIDFSNPSEVEDALVAVKASLSQEGALRTGWKAFNRMLGSVGAFRRGEFVITGGLQHQFKTGLSLCLLTHFCLFNKPFLRDSTKQPLIVFVTLENEITDNLLFIYKYLRENETGIKVDTNSIDVAEAAAYVCGRLEETGFRVKMIRFDPSEFTISAFTNYIDGIISQGFEISAIFVDYLNMLPKTGLDAKVAGDDIRLLFRRMRNYTTPLKIRAL